MGGAATVHDDPGALWALAPAWDELAAEAGLPSCSAAWLIAWVRHAVDGELRVAAVHDGGELTGILPTVLVRDTGGVRRLRLLGAGTSTGISPLARPGQEAHVAAAASAAIAARGPGVDVIDLEGVPADSPWPALLAQTWPGARRRLLRREVEQPEPLISLSEPGYDAWLAAKSSNFRQQVRRARRALERDGGQVRRTRVPEELERDLAAFVRLHEARWEDRGGSAVITPEVEAMLAESAPALLASGTLDLWSVDLDGEIIGSQLWLRAGGVVTMWLSGSDDRHAAVRPAMLVMDAVVRDAYESGLRTVSLGAGGQDYKRRFSDAEAQMAWWSLPLPGARLPLLLGGQGLRRARRDIAARVTPERKAQLRRVAGRARAVLRRGA